MGQSGVTKDIPPGSTVWGLPAIPHKKFKEQQVALRRLPRTTARFREVERLVHELQEQIKQAG